MPFSYLRTVHFADTDAAGLIFFPNYLAICHEAYEEALGACGIDRRTFFSRERETIVPVVKSEATYRHPLRCGDKLRITVTPKLLTADSFELRFEMIRLELPEKVAALVRTEQVCITTATRKRTPLPPELAAWIAGG